MYLVPGALVVFAVRLGSKKPPYEQETSKRSNSLGRGPQGRGAVGGACPQPQGVVLTGSDGLPVNLFTDH